MQNNLQFCKPIFSLEEEIDHIGKFRFEKDHYKELSSLNFGDDFATLFLTNILILFDQVDEYLLDETKIALDIAMLYFNEEYNEFMFTYIPVENLDETHKGNMTDFIRNTIYYYYDFENVSKNRIVEILTAIRKFEYESKEDINKLLIVFKSREYGKSSAYSNIEKKDEKIVIKESSKLKTTMKIKNKLKNIIFS